MVGYLGVVGKQHTIDVHFTPSFILQNTAQYVAHIKRHSFETPHTFFLHE